MDFELERMTRSVLGGGQLELWGWVRIWEVREKERLAVMRPPSILSSASLLYTSLGVDLTKRRGLWPLGTGN